MTWNHLEPVRQDVSLWRRLAKMSSDQGFMRQAIYCYNRVIAADKGDLDALWDRAVLYSNVDQPRRVRPSSRTFYTCTTLTVLTRAPHLPGPTSARVHVQQTSMGKAVSLCCCAQWRCSVAQISGVPEYVQSVRHNGTEPHQ
jgi:hypothetical protein